MAGLNRRQIIAALGLAAGGFAMRGMAQAAVRPALPQPALLDPAQMLRAGKAGLPFAQGFSGGYGYNGLCPGPMISARKGQEVRLRVANTLDEETIFHWHGLLAPPEADGQPQFPVPPGATQEVCFPVTQRAGLSWYHPHPHGATARQAWHGLGGLFVIRDDEENALNLPSGAKELFLALRDAEIDGSIIGLRDFSSEKSCV
ncbi:MAG: multicopper oxidase domain-containing protein [Paracoccus sp. (in: a-proteobacteria)]|uniref:multicopper oxidase family protein n=1 Tax=Paracoccus sp. TaxID=267 RepID=UPI0026E0F62E|nr:multicopper oxidase domain-containing protein [Paracoccus sp. (in: a-proteobacteria)]MDO5614325.1 multicopper oxidase domain-containing protein [Paracoccus sp. (in: a-proteobacteria)]